MSNPINWSDEQIGQVVGSVEEAEDNLLFVNSGEFWAHFGLEDTMQELQAQITERLNAAGIDVAFEVTLQFFPGELPQLMDFEAPASPEPIDLTVRDLRALSIQQPWVEMILRGEKNLEYRSRLIREMGPLLLHASGTVVPENFEGSDHTPEDLPLRALVGVVDVVGCAEVEGEEGLYAYQLAHPRRFSAPIAYSGAASIFRVPTATVRDALLALPGGGRS